MPQQVVLVVQQVVLFLLQKLVPQQGVLVAQQVVPFLLQEVVLLQVVLVVFLAQVVVLETPVTLVIHIDPTRDLAQVVVPETLVILVVVDLLDLQDRTQDFHILIPHTPMTAAYV